jgi:hypothetical protein
LVSGFLLDLFSELAGDGRWYRRKVNQLRIIIPFL